MLQPPATLWCTLIFPLRQTPPPPPNAAGGKNTIGRVK
uniref:Uncharacterized protein n=1 Tax=Anopheles minimus TaxID=112268 RepID=A0A182WPU0_9DIPT